ncbi:MAG: hypothetical protein H6741_21835 [Alphaproteobacteria bacterium]|nr:hypothetical protein [Alphaproteobacteria bacterium]MCB9795354.1 hypothetical protein [Alphaproteobacteria bacterium]
MLRALALLALAPGCMDYGFDKLSDKPGPADVDSAWEALDSAPPADAPPEDSGWEPGNEEQPPLECDELPLTGWSWLGSAPFAAPEDPSDGAGLPFYEPGFDASGFQAVALPDRDIPVYTDRVYRARVTLDALPVNLSLEVQSDDGLWIWVNGEPVGHWGGAWQQEGCVNESALCLQTIRVDAIDVTPYLVEGENLIAARVSNPVANAYFEIIPHCIEPE